MTLTTDPAATARRTLPGDPPERRSLHAALRVDHAGEYGARRIYQGQLAVLRGTRHEPVIAEMAAQEEAHLAFFEAELPRRGVRPTALLPLWHVAGYALGVATAALGPRAAMACTVAVEEAIDRHYRAQIEALGNREPDLAAKLESFRQDELHHRDTGLEHGAERAPAYRLLKAAIGFGCRAAIRLTERL